MNSQEASVSPLPGTLGSMLNAGLELTGREGDPEDLLVSAVLTFKVPADFEPIQSDNLAILFVRASGYVQRFYSVRSAFIGSIEAARRAGK
jgi:hypothetical protein